LSLNEMNPTWCDRPGPFLPLPCTTKPRFRRWNRSPLAVASPYNAPTAPTRWSTRPLCALGPPSLPVCERRMTPSSRCLALGLSAAMAAAASAAEIPKPPESSRAQQLVLQMRTGSVRVAGGDTPAAEAAKNRAAIKTVAEWLAYSIASPPYNGEPVPREDKTPTGVDRSMRALFEEAERFSYLPIATGNQGRVSQEQLEYGAEFGKA